ncbi:MAG: PfkB family carbohydrate kinase [Candidatus Zixiibacteriota bacterium]
MSKTKSAQIDCLGLGIMPLDLLYTVPRFPGAGGKVNATALCVQGGGPVPNAMVGLARLGRKTALVALLGHDWAGKMGLDELKKDRVDTRFLIFKKAPSATAAGFVEDGSGRRTIAFHRVAGISPRDLTTSRYPIPRIVHLDGRDLEACIKLAKWARRVGALVSFDIGSIRNDVSPVFPLVDHLVIADAYALPFTGSRTVKQAIHKLRRYCSGTIVVTQGTKGAVGFEDGNWSGQPAYRVNPVDTTGAGDAFHVGYLFGLLEGHDLSTRLKLGAAVAALKCLKPGARDGMPNRRQLQTFLKNKPATYD